MTRSVLDCDQSNLTVLTSEGAKELTAELGMQARIPNLEDMSFEPFSTFEEERLIDGLVEELCLTGKLRTRVHSRAVNSQSEYTPKLGVFLGILDEFLGAISFPGTASKFLGRGR